MESARGALLQEFYSCSAAIMECRRMSRRPCRGVLPRLLMLRSEILQLEVIIRQAWGIIQRQISGQRHVDEAQIQNRLPKP